jgi:NAD+ kinase
VKIGLVANPEKPEAIRLAHRAVEKLRDRAELAVGDETPAVGLGLPHLVLEELRPDALIAIGGDGTFLHALARTSAPMLPINAGTVGVLAEVGGARDEEFDHALAELLSGNYHLEGRMKLAAEVGGTPLPDATNEYVVHSARAGKMGLFEVALDGEVAGRIRADGLIVASPTGSTAYSLSSLGPVVDPALDALVVTSIAPFRAEARAIVLEPLRTVRVTAVEPGRDAVAIADGAVEVPMPVGRPITVYRSPRRATIVRFGAAFFHRLKGKRILPWRDESGGGDPADLSAAP